MAIIRDNEQSAEYGNSDGNKYSHRYDIVGQHNIEKENLKEDEVLKAISNRIRDGRRLIIPIGLPQSGKSMFLASLMAFAFRAHHNECNFSDLHPENVSAIPEILKRLDSYKVLTTTTTGDITFIDLDMKATYRKKTIKITLIDLAGEDVERIIGRKPQSQSSEIIKKIIASCVAGKAIFAILTPVWQNTDLDNFSQQDEDKSESDGMKSFIDIVKANNPKLFTLAKFLLVVSKWDLLSKRIYPAKYLSIFRHSLFNEIQDKTSYGLIPYSAGDVVGEIVIKPNLISPRNFWWSLYKMCNGEHILPWWKRLFI